MLLLAACTASSVQIGDDSASTPPLESGPPTFDTAESLGPAPADSSPEPDDSGDTDDVERLYVPGVILTMELEFDDDATRQLRWGSTEWVEGTLTFDGESLTVGARLKGSSTATDLDSKPSFKVDVDRYVDGQKLNGHTKFNLHNQLIDPSMMSETLTYETYRDAGMPAPRTAYVRLTINGEDYGLYNAVEPPSREFLRLWFGDDTGNLYENGWQDCEVTDPSCFDVEQDDEGTHEPLYALSEAARLTGDEWDTTIFELLDEDAFVGAMAMEMLLAHWDGYAYDLSNYRLYHHPTEDRFHFLPWSADLDYGWRPWSYPTCGRYGVEPSDYDDGILALRCEQSETCHAAIVDRIEVENERWAAADPVARIEALYTLIRDDVYTDSKKSYNNAAFEQHVACVTDWVTQRPDEIRAWVAAERE